MKLLAVSGNRIRIINSISDGRFSKNLNRRVCVFNVNISRDGSRAVVIVVAVGVVIIVEYLTTAQAGHRTRFGRLVHHVCSQESIIDQLFRNLSRADEDSTCVRISLVHVSNCYKILVAYNISFSWKKVQVLVQNFLFEFNGLFKNKISNLRSLVKLAPGKANGGRS